MVRVLQAEESLRRVTEHALGFGLVPKMQADMIKRAWRRDAEMLTREPRKTVTLDEIIGNAPGIGVHFVNKDGTSA